jgi:hypothetical protein
MTLVDDGDLVRGIGYVTLYAGYLEESIEHAFVAVAAIEKDTRAEMQRWPISRKLDYIERAIGNWTSLPNELLRFLKSICGVKELLEERNLYIHGRVYADPLNGDVLKPSRQNQTEILARSSDLYHLANRLFAARDPFNWAAMFALPRYAESILIPRKHEKS